MRPLRLAWVVPPALAACRGGQEREPEKEPPPTEGGALVYGRVLDGRGDPVAGALVAAGGLQARSGGTGWYALAHAPAGAAAVAVSDGDGPEAIYPAELREGRATFLDLRALAWQESRRIRPALGGSLKLPAGATVEAGPGAFEPERVTLRALALRPDDAAGDLPGGVVGLDGDGEPVALDVARAVGWIALDEKDAPVGIQKDAPDGGPRPRVTLSVPADPEGGEPALWRVDPDTGRWVETGRARCEQGACSGRMDRAGWWAIAAPVATSCARACLAEPIAGVRVTARAEEIAGHTSSATGEDGCACLPAVADTQVRLAAAGVAGADASALAFTSERGSCDAAGTCAAPREPLAAPAPVLQLHVVWGEQPADLDAHATGPCAPEAGCDGGRFHVFYAERDAGDAALEVDDADGGGPETVTVTRARAGVYRFAVHAFGARGGIAGSGARALLVAGGRVLTRAAPEKGEGNAWLVADVTVDEAGGAAVRAIDTVVVAQVRGEAFHP